MSKTSILTQLIEARGISPQVGEGTWLAPNASVIGDVVLGKNCSVWFHVTIRGDVFPIRVGDECNIQDNVVLHGTYKKCGATLEKRVSVGHSAILHGCHIGEGTLIGMGAIVMDFAKIGKHSLVGAGSLVTENSVFEEGSLILGRPAKVVRLLTEEERKRLEQSADNYLLYKTWY